MAPSLAKSIPGEEDSLSHEFCSAVSKESLHGGSPMGARSCNETAILIKVRSRFANRAPQLALSRHSSCSNALIGAPTGKPPEFSEAISDLTDGGSGRGPEADALDSPDSTPESDDLVFDFLDIFFGQKNFPDWR